MSIKLLVADDSITIQKVIGIIFGGEEYSLTVVDNGLAAVEKAREISPDVLLIDALMPGMSGYEVCEAVRAIPALADKPILILTGSFEPFDEDKAKRSGADGFLAKPFESQQIVNKVKEFAELGASRVAKIAATPEPFIAPEPAAAFTFQESPVPFEPPASEPLPAFTFPEPEPAAAFAFSEPEPPAPFEPPAPEAPQSATPSDIWGAFTTPDAEPATVVSISPEPPDSAVMDAFEPDVFAIVSEESESELVKPASPPLSSPQITGTQWVPVEEQTYEFEEENIADIPYTALSQSGTAVQSSDFGDIEFEDGAPAQKIPVSTAIIIEPAVSDFIAPEPEFLAPEPEFIPPAAPSIEPEKAQFESVASSFIALTADVHKPVATVEIDDYVPAVCAPAVCAPAVCAPPVCAPPVAIPAVTPPATLTEEQLKAAISAVSKEVIERIVWEVVPDLADAMIREAIRKIKEGV